MVGSFRQVKQAITDVDRPLMSKVSLGVCLILVNVKNYSIQSNNKMVCVL
jgi:hypothetical protein